MSLPPPLHPGLLLRRRNGIPTLNIEGRTLTSNLEVMR